MILQKSQKVKVQWYLFQSRTKRFLKMFIESLTFCVTHVLRVCNRCLTVFELSDRTLQATDPVAHSRGFEFDFQPMPATPKYFRGFT